METSISLTPTVLRIRIPKRELASRSAFKKDNNDVLQLGCIDFMKKTEVYYTEKFIFLDAVYGYAIDPMVHTMTLMIKYNRDVEIQFESQEAYDDAVSTMRLLGEQ
jgi:hypothetical protein